MKKTDSYTLLWDSIDAENSESMASEMSKQDLRKLLNINEKFGISLFNTRIIAPGAITMSEAEFMELSDDNDATAVLINLSAEYDIPAERILHLIEMDKQNRIAVLSEPMVPMIIKNDRDTDVYCPNCGTTLSGGWDAEHDDELLLYQCPHCGQSVDPTRVTKTDAEDCQFAPNMAQ